jgi:hypothetical protein
MLDARNMSTPDENNEDSHPLGLFFGGLPPFMIFKADIDEVTEIVEAHEELEDDGQVLLNKAAELGIIGVVAYFESFCKHQFAALVHCSPPLLERFAERRPQVSIPIRDLVHVGSRYVDSIGYVVAERFDFGSGKLINGLFTDLLNVTPLPKGDVLRFDDLLNDRHLLVYHSGLYTLEYAREKGLLGTSRGDPFLNLLVVSKAYYRDARNFLLASARKIVTVTHSALDNLLKKDVDLLKHSRPDALEYLLWQLKEGRSPENPTV